MRYKSVLILCLVVLVGVSGLIFAEGEPVDVPRIQGVTIDGDLSDWGDRGFRLDMLSAAWASRRDITNGSARVRIAWDDGGLLLRFDVKDDAFSEAGYEEIWFGDCIELFTASGVGARGFVQYLVQPGMAEDQPTPRFLVKDERGMREFDDSKLAPDMARKATDDGYTMEIRLPWDAFNLTEGREGEIAALTFNVSDVDEYRGSRLMLVWHPVYGVWGGNTHRMRGFRLSRDKTSPPVIALASTRYSDYARELTVSVEGLGRLVGKTVDVRSGGQSLGSFDLSEENSWASGSLTLPSPVGTPDEIRFLIDGKVVATAQPESAAAILARRVLEELDPVFDQHVFSGDRFPKVSLRRPVETEMIIGPYEIETTFYNASFEEVTEPAEPGRYGAVVRVVPEEGIAYTRFRTLYRTPEGFSWRRTALEGQLDLSEAFGVNPAVTQNQSDQIGAALKSFIAIADQQNDKVAVLMAGLAGTSPDDPPADVFRDVEALDRQWWVTLKRQIQGTGERWPEGMETPNPVDGSPAPVLRAGTMEEAGMVTDAPGRIDAILTQWANDSDEAFIAVVARNGVIVHHKAYGMRDGKPMTVDTPSRMASLTKLLNGACMMMLVDRGLVDLDAPVATYLPPFEGRRPERPLVVRDLFVHTAGMWGHWGDDLNDFDLRVAEFAPYLEVGKQFAYNGMDLAVGGKIMEAITGRSLPNYYKTYLFDPLGMSHTVATRGSSGAESVAMDMAKFGQMLCNGGSYGDTYFFSPKTLEQMLPKQLTMVLGEGAGKVWGIGTEWMDQNYLSDRTFGHGSAAMATLRIDLDNNLVVSMTRNRDGRNFNKYHGLWLATVADCMIDPTLSTRAQQAQADRMNP